MEMNESLRELLGFSANSRSSKYTFAPELQREPAAWKQLYTWDNILGSQFDLVGNRSGVVSEMELLSQKWDSPANFQVNN